MPIFQTGGYRVKASAVGRVERAIGEFVEYVKTGELGTEMYLAWQEQNDPTKFLHLFIFADEAAQARHSESDAVRRFESAYSPELAGGDVVFTHYRMIAGKRDAFSPARDVLKAFYDAVVRRDLAAARGCLADDMVFKGVFETYPSADAYVATLTGLLSITIRLDVKKIIGQGSDAAIFFELETKAPAEATVLVAERHEVRNGKIVYAESAFDARPYAAMFSGRG
ncbi:MAG TPA: nuclear transport factor 2 family protein [Thermoanaerobaculia bacterium]|nr:nuclear transport factor 2 family protein [Thermoanaerobaculia bacterium]